MKIILKRSFIHFILGIILLVPSLVISQQRTFQVHTVAFYNVENLFDTKDDPLTKDDDRTPEGKDRWTLETYRKKIQNIAKVIADIGSEVSHTHPSLIGLAEVENYSVLEDLIKTPPLDKIGYRIIHVESPDERGIDVALLYDPTQFEPIYFKNNELILFDEEGLSRDYTRDELLVSGMLQGDLIHIIINHWPSRRGGPSKSEIYRIAAAELCRHLIDKLQTEDVNAKILVMGDFNDDPIDKSIKEILRTHQKKQDCSDAGLYNPMEQLFAHGSGSLGYRDSWNLFDQIILSCSFMDSDYKNFKYYKSGIFNPPYLITQTGPYKGYPFRSFVNGSFSNGFSDHLPVYVCLIREIVSP